MSESRSSSASVFFTLGEENVKRGGWQWTARE